MLSTVVAIVDYDIMGRVGILFGTRLIILQG